MNPSTAEAAPIHDLSAERAVVGAAMAHTAAFERLRGAVLAEDFYRPAHETIWRALDALRENGTAIDPTSLMLALRRDGILERVGGAGYLHELFAAGITPAAYECARAVHEAHRVRRISEHVVRMAQMVTELAGDHDALLGHVARQAVELEMLVDERNIEDPVEGMTKFSELWQQHPSGSVNWLVPDLLTAEDVWMLLGSEGSGKSWYTRQLALCLASGVHPLHPARSIEPVRVLYVDLENARAMVAHESRLLGHQVVRFGAYDEDFDHLLLRPDGLDLRDPAGRMTLERAVVQSGAQVLILGPLYKAFKRGRDDWDHAAEDVRDVLDRLRYRYGLALIIEHHMPKGGAAERERPRNPFGSSVWQRWPSIGNVIHRVGDNAWALSEFRGTRMERELPAGLERGGPLPWSPVWTKAELVELMWDNLKPKTKNSA